MPSKRKKYNARFPAGRIKKIMQTDEEVGKVAQAVPIIISRTLELFVKSLLTKSMQITQARNAKTLTPSHMKQCILSESRFDFLKDLVKSIPDASIQEDNENNAFFEDNLEKMELPEDIEVVLTEPSSPEMVVPQAKMQVGENCNNEQSSSSRRPVIQYGPKIVEAQSPLNFCVKDMLNDDDDEPKLHITIASEELTTHNSKITNSVPLPKVLTSSDSVPPLISIAHNLYGQNTSDNLLINEDYDN